MDIAEIEGYRRKGAYSTQTMYYVADLRALAIRKLGQARYEHNTPHGREKSGVAQRERDAKAANKAAAAAVAADQAPFAVVPASRLTNLTMDKLRRMVVRYEGKVGERVISKAEAAERIIKAGYSMEREKAVMAQKEAAAKAEKEECRAAQAKREQAKEKREEEKKQRVRAFEAGALSVDRLNYQELQKQCRRLSIPIKQLDVETSAQMRLPITVAMKKRDAEEAGLTDNGAENKLQKFPTRIDDVY